MCEDVRLRLTESDYARIDITNDYMFSTVMQDARLCTMLLECLLPGRKIQRVKYRYFADDGTEIADPGADALAAPNDTQKALPGCFGYRGVRLDAWMDDGASVYDIEMQTASIPALAQRSRFYQSHIDLAQLNRGASFDLLRPSYVIFICKFDPFGRQRWRYSFRNRCDEDSTLELNDGAYKLFFNTGGSVGDIAPELRELLEYMNDAVNYPVAQSSNELIHEIDSAVIRTKMKPEWRNSYMYFEVKQREAELRGEAIGQARGEAIGQARGEAIGQTRGEYNKARNDARNLLKEGLPVELISRAIDLPEDEVIALKGELEM